MSATRIAIAGLGAIGRAVARRLTDGIPGLRLVGIATGNADKARAWLNEQKIDCPLVGLEDFPERADLAMDLLRCVLSELSDARIKAYVPGTSRIAIELLRHAGFESAPSSLRMYWGTAPGPEDPWILAMGAPEKG